MPEEKLLQYFSELTTNGYSLAHSGIDYEALNKFLLLEKVNSPKLKTHPRVSPVTPWPLINTIHLWNKTYRTIYMFCCHIYYDVMYRSCAPLKMHKKNISRPRSIKCNQTQNVLQRKLARHHQLPIRGTLSGMKTTKCKPLLHLQHAKLSTTKMSNKKPAKPLPTTAEQAVSCMACSISATPQSSACTNIAKITCQTGNPGNKCFMIYLPYLKPNRMQMQEWLLQRYANIFSSTSSKISDFLDGYDTSTIRRTMQDIQMAHLWKERAYGMDNVGFHTTRCHEVQRHRRMARQSSRSTLVQVNKQQLEIFSDHKGGITLTMADM